jgi:hypothetical protein
MPQKVAQWVGLMGGDLQLYGTHSLRRTKATLIDQRTQNCRRLPRPGTTQDRARNGQQRAGDGGTDQV